MLHYSHKHCTLPKLRKSFQKKLNYKYSCDVITFDDVSNDASEFVSLTKYFTS